MPLAPPRACHHGGCPNTTTGKFCTEHAAPARRPTRQQQGYTNEWLRESRAWLALHQWCMDHLAKGEHVLATEVDHIKPHDGDLALFWDRSNWQGLCHSCHSRKTWRQNRSY